MRARSERQFAIFFHCAKGIKKYYVSPAEYYFRTQADCNAIHGIQSFCRRPVCKLLVVERDTKYF